MALTVALLLPRAPDEYARAARKSWEDRVDAVVKKSAEGIAEATEGVTDTDGTGGANYVDTDSDARRANARRPQTRQLGCRTRVDQQDRQPLLED